MSATEIFANQPFTTVIAGGTEPISGTEFWTVSTSTPFPTASTGISQFHVTDTSTSAASEIILVTNVNPITNVWSVTRGAEGTTPVAHNAGFTITQVLTAGWLTGVTGSTLPAVSAGAVLYGNPSATAAWLAGNTSSAKEFLSSTGSGGTANSPQWGTLVSADIPNPLNQNTTGTAGNVTGVVAVANGGNGGTAQTPYAVLTGGTVATSPFQQVSGLGTSGQVLTSAGASVLPAWQALPAAGASAGGTITLAGDLGSTAASPQVVSTHLASPLPVTQGGNGGTAQTAYAVMTGGTAATSALQQVSGVGSSGQVLTSNGPAALPSWQPNVALVNPMSVHGDMIYESAGLAAAALAGNTSATKNFLTSTGSGGTANSPAWGTITASDVPTLNQNTTGTAGGLSTILAIGSGGTGQASQQAALNALAGGTTPSGDYLRANGTNVTLSALLASDLSGNVTITHGGTGAGNQQAAITALTGTQAAGEYLRSDGTNATLSALQAADLTGTVAVLNGGTGGTAVTAYAVVTGGTSATTTLQTVSGLGTSGQSLISNGAGALPSWQTPAGRILSFYHLAPTTQTGFGINSTTPAAFGSGTIATQSFTAPPSGNVLATFTFSLVTSSSGVYVLMYLSPAGSTTTISSDIFQYESPSAGFAPVQAFPFYLTGLTSGNSYNFDLVGAVTSAQSGTIIAYTQTSYPPTLGTNAVRGGPVIVTITAL